MNLINQILTDFLFKKFGQTGKWYRKHAIEMKNDCQSEYKDKLTSLLKYSFDNVPYYREHFITNGILSSDDIVCNDIQKLPLLTKDIIRERTCDLTSSNLGGISFKSNTSGGSTGIPVKFLQDASFYHSSRAIKVLMDESVGFTLGHKKMLLWGSERDLFEGSESFRTRLLKKVKNEYWFNTFNLSDEKLSQCVEWMRINNPKFVLAYVESIYELARFINRNNLRLDSPEIIMTTAGTLTESFRTEIEKAFPLSLIVNRYGSREVGDIACYNPAVDSLVVSHPTQYVEILNEDGEHVSIGQVGEVVVTNLTNRVMPLIRYRIGDMAEYSGEVNGLVTLKSIIGRSSDTFINSMGHKVHGEFFTHLFYDKEWVNKFQVVQKTVDRIILRIVLISDSLTIRDNASKDLLGMISDIKYVMGDSCNVEVIFETEILPTKSGKYRYTISEICK